MLELCLYVLMISSLSNFSLTLKDSIGTCSPAKNTDSGMGGETTVLGRVLFNLVVPVSGDTAAMNSTLEALIIRAGIMELGITRKVHLLKKNERPNSSGYTHFIVPNL